MIRRTIIAATVLGMSGAAVLPATAPAVIVGATLLPFAGTGALCSPSTAACGDGGPASAAQLRGPRGVAVLPGGAVIVADTDANRIRRVGPDGSITTAAGSGTPCGAPTGLCGDGGAATSAQLTAPQGVAAIDEDSFLIADTGNHKIRRVDGATITTVAGTGTSGFGGEGGPAVTAQMSGPRDVAARGAVSFLVADTGNVRVRRVVGGSITTVAGAGTFCTSPSDGCGDGGPSGQAALSGPAGISLLPGDGFLIAEPIISRVRSISRDDGGGTIVRAAGRQDAGAATFSGDGGPATSAGVHAPDDVVALPAGGFAVVDTSNHRVRLVDPSGRIDTAAGDGNPCSDATSACGDGGPAASAQLNAPRGVAVDGQGDLIVGDTSDVRVRRVDLPASVSAPIVPVPTGADPAAAPTVNETVLVQTLKGTVYVRLPGSRRAVPLDQVRLVPDGSVLDTRRGRARLTVARAGGTTDDADLSEGIMKVDQRSDGSLVDLRLAERIIGCPVAVRDRGSAGAQVAVQTMAATLGASSSPLAFGARAQASARKGRRTRRGRVQADGRFRTDGKYGSAVVRGTQWLTIDDCRRGRRAQTRVVVREGKVAVRDFRLAKTTLVRAGRRYVAYARGS